MTKNRPTTASEHKTFINQEEPHTGGCRRNKWHPKSIKHGMDDLGDFCIFLHMADEIDRMELLSQTARIVSAYVRNNAISANDLPTLTAVMFSRISELVDDTTEHGSELEPFVPIKKSITPEFIICLEDGKRLKMLKRHLRARYNLTPDEYRARWGLPADYPMTAPEYAKRRSELAKELGLGKNG